MRTNWIYGTIWIYSKVKLKEKHVQQTAPAHYNLISRKSKNFDKVTRIYCEWDANY